MLCFQLARTTYNIVKNLLLYIYQLCRVMHIKMYMYVMNPSIFPQVLISVINTVIMFTYYQS